MARRPRLAGPAVRRPRIYEGQARETIIGKVAEILATARSSKFEHEAVCRHALRQGLVLAGHRWALADLEAASVVSAALASIGAVRPSWALGQPEATIPRENCQRCGLPIADEDMAAGRRYCSDWCASSARTHRLEWFALTEERARKAANFIAATAAAPQRRCAVCQEPFQALSESQTTCSRQCGSAWRINPALDKSCAHCEKPFHGSLHRNRYCSPECARAGMKASLPMRICADPKCRIEFQPGKPTAIYCSERCRDRVSAQRIRAAKKAAKARDPTPG